MPAILPRSYSSVALLEQRTPLSIGNLNESIASPREILRPVIALGGHSFILVHNHPSGSIEASKGDIAVANSIREAAAPLCVKMKDFIIIGDGAFAAFSESQPRCFPASVIDRCRRARKPGKIAAAQLELATAIVEVVRVLGRHHSRATFHDAQTSIERLRLSLAGKAKGESPENFKLANG